MRGLGIENLVAIICCKVLLLLLSRLIPLDYKQYCFLIAACIEWSCYIFIKFREFKVIHSGSRQLKQENICRNLNKKGGV